MESGWLQTADERERMRTKVERLELPQQVALWVTRRSLSLLVLSFRRMNPDWGIKRQEIKWQGKGGTVVDASAEPPTLFINET